MEWWWTPILKDRTFFFFSYEGLRLRQPATLQGAVPDATARAEAEPALQPYLSAYPIPNAPELTDNLAGFNASISNPSSLNSYSMRVDHSIGSKLKLFGRYAYSPSSTASAGSPGSTGISPNSDCACSAQLPDRFAAPPGRSEMHLEA